MENKNTVQRAFDHGVDLVLFAWRGKHHVQKITRVGQIVLWVDERLALRVLVSHGDHGRHFGDQANGRDVAMVRIGDVGGVVIRSEEHTSELQSLMRISYAVFCLNKKTK